MKKLFLLTVSCAAAFTLFACAKNKPPVNPVVKEEPAAKAEAPVDTAALAKAKADSIEKARLEAERLEKERARVEKLFNELMSEDVYFDFDKSELTEKAKEILTQVGDILLKEPRFVIVVEGHTDARGTEDYNMTLGSKRAMKVKEFLNAYGVGDDRMETVSYGKEKPKVAGESEEAYAQNRRANFKVNIRK
ncbi:OmpA family protein [Hallerella porci]|uniref:Peptidoglycan-associated lipoprotein n=1 Tax=Hallerella porci TaxID=1945871 RepID=A0ABX5LQ52_9BACT|nr:OmpA family protein [Hallerella porci]PWL04034.1 peptidoglycan-associated lipoprotein [Hallerella porci]